MSNENSGSEEKDEHGCVIGKETYDEEQQKCVPIPKPTSEHAVDEVLAENLKLKSDLKAVKKTVDELKKQLKSANDVLEAQTKAKLIGEILPRSAFTIEDLTPKTLVDLKGIRATLDQARYPTYKTITPGPIGTDENQENGLTVGDLSIPTANKRKLATERRA